MAWEGERMCGKAVESVTETTPSRRLYWLRKGRPSENMCYLMGMNDAGSREKPVWQIEVLRREGMEGSLECVKSPSRP